MKHKTIKMRILIIAGTRPEIIKCAPLYLNWKNDDNVEVFLCNSGQHIEMSLQALEIFGIQPEYELRIMTKNQQLHHITMKISEKLPRVLHEVKPDFVIVQGDTTTAMMSSIVTFNSGIPVVHLEAGLRTGNLSEPFPEEANRKIISCITSIHLCPTQHNVDKLFRENINQNVYKVGNTIVDALEYVKQKFSLDLPPDIAVKIDGKPYILVTAHRRENHGEGIVKICTAIRELSHLYPEIVFIFPIHHNPNIQSVVKAQLGNTKNIVLIPPVNYITLLSLLRSCTLCITDSGGIQEEAPSFSKYTFVLRNFTERMETIEAGVSELVGTDKELIVSRVSEILNSGKCVLNNIANPFGDGQTSKRVSEILHHFLNDKSILPCR